MSSFIRLQLAVVGVLFASLVGVSPAVAAEPWWHLTSGSSPSYLQSEGERQKIVVTAVDLGEVAANGAQSPIRIVDTLPHSLTAVSITAVVGNSGPGGKCQLKPLLECTFIESLPAYQSVEIRVSVKVSETAESGELNEVSVSGGEAPSVSIARPIAVSSEPMPFGFEQDELTPEEVGGAPDIRAGSHPFQLTNTLVLNNRPIVDRTGAVIPQSVALAKNIVVKLPPGLVGDPGLVARCPGLQFLAVEQPPSGEANACPAQTVVGVAKIAVSEPNFAGLLRYTVPLFNLEPSFGEPARFGFFIPQGRVPVYLATSVRSGNGEDYGITVTAPETTQTISFVSSEVTFWGTPTDPRHDNVRGWGCLYSELGTTKIPCQPLGVERPTALLTLPTRCSGAPLVSSADVDSWALPELFPSIPASPVMPTLDGCNQVPFSPGVTVESTTASATSPTGLNFNLNVHDEGLPNPEGLAESSIKKAVVTLPEGMTANPSLAAGLVACSEAQYDAETVSTEPGGPGCPSESKIGSVEVTTPLLEQTLRGSLYIADPAPLGELRHNPFNSLLALYVVIKNPETGILVKLAGKVEPNLSTGQLVSVFDNIPQFPISHFELSFRQGQRSPLISPPACGAYTTQAELYPWADPETPLHDTSVFQIETGVGGGPCPSGGVLPFNPGIVSGTQNNNAGTFSPFYLHLTRTDGEQEISGFSTNLPAGLTGDLSGIPFCPDANIEAARHESGAQEEAEPSCPAASQIGHTLVGTGVASVLAYVPGKIYLAGPFHGAPFSLVSVTSAVVGPFDLGTVVLRFGLNIDPYTAQVSVSPTTSEPIPTIIDGIVTHVRDIRVYIDRQNFTLNPTSCNPLAIGSTLTANEGASTTVTSPFQAASCANLKFAPKFAVSTSGKTSRAKGASLAVKLTYPSTPLGSQANIARVKVDLPKQLPSRLTTLQKACTAAQFNTNPAGCPAASFIGHAKAVTPLLPVPLEGPAIFVSHGGEAFPSLIMVLQGYGVTIDLVGSTNISKAGITSSTFKTVPDQPVGSFELTLPEGKYSALAANGNLCTSKLAMPTEFVAQNGLKINESTKISVTGCAKVKSLTRAQKLKAALKMCHKEVKGKRAVCEVRARQQFGVLKKRK